MAVRREGHGISLGRPHRQSAIAPLVISWGWGESFTKAFEWPGTRDFTSWLSVTADVEYHQRVAPQLRHGYCNDLAASAAELIEQAWDVPASAPQDMRAAMATIQLPTAAEATREAADRIHDRLIDKHSIEVPVIDFAGKLWTRISAQVYNDLSDCQKLRDAVHAVV